MGEFEVAGGGEEKEMKELFAFLRELARNNSREWLSAHNEEYQKVKELRDSIAREFIDEVALIEPQAARLSVRNVTYRFMRDTRFSADKSPYKTHIGIFVCPPYGKKSLLSGYYLHLEPGNSIICGGNYCLPSKLLGVLRREIRDNIDEYIGIVESPEFKQYFPTVGMERLKTAPKGFDRNWEYIDYVRPKDFGVEMGLPDSFFYGKNAVRQLRPQLEQIKRLNDFINFGITESGLPVMREGRH